MGALEEFETTMTLCFTPEHLGVAPHYTSPPKREEDFAEFAAWAVERYACALKDSSAADTMLTTPGASEVLVSAQD
jgi:hypothetical protein